jgi:hypothetical protein
VGIDPAQFCKYIIRPALRLLKMSSPAAEILLLGTILRIKEPSTWRGVALFMSAFFITISPETFEHILTVGVGLSGLIGIFTTDGVK